MTVDNESNFTRTDDNPAHGDHFFTETRNTKRLLDKIVTAFHHACDEGNIAVAKGLLIVMELTLRHARSAANLRDGRKIKLCKETLVAAHERLWMMRYSETFSLVNGDDGPRPDSDKASTGLVLTRMRPI